MMQQKYRNLPDTPYVFILYFVKMQWGSFLFMLFAGSVWAINNSLYPYFVKLIVDQVATWTPGLAKPLRQLAFPLSSLLIVWIIMEIVLRIHDWVALRAFPIFRKNIRETAFAYLSVLF